MRESNDNNEIIIINETTTTVEEDPPYPICLIRNSSRSNNRISTHGRQIDQKIRRLIHKTGKYELYHTNNNNSLHLGSIYFYDFVNTLITNSWYWILIVLFCGLFLSFLLFACIYMVIASTNYDDLQTNTETCLIGIQNFTGYLLFSVETQMTIGFGTRTITHYCIEAVFVLCLQILTGTCICGVIISIFYEKISGSKKINSMNSFSRYATICQRDNVFYLIFRIRDIHQRYQCNNQINAYILIMKKGGEYRLKTLKLENIGFLIWPIEIVHRIDETSPLWDLSAKDLIVKSMEIIVTMQGVSLSTSNISSTTTSYLSREILWGHRFIKCVKFDKNNNNFIVNHRLFNKTKEIPTPLCSAKRYNQVVYENLIYNKINSTNSYSIGDYNSNNCDNSDNGRNRDQDSGIASPSLSSDIIVHNNNTTPKDKQEHLENDPLLVCLKQFLAINDKINEIKYEETQF